MWRIITETRHHRAIPVSAHPVPYERHPKIGSSRSECSFSSDTGCLLLSGCSFVIVSSLNNPVSHLRNHFRNIPVASRQIMASLVIHERYFVGVS